MRYLLSETSRPVLTRLAEARTLCAFDFDGTLAPIVEHPDDAKLPRQTHSLIHQLLDFYPCVILSGRCRADLRQKLSGLAVDAAIGNHGAETSDVASEHDPVVKRWQETLEDELRPIPGLWVEYKGRSLAVHYRLSGARDVRQRVLKAAKVLRAAKIYEGKKVVNIVIAGDPNKGTALKQERDRLGCDTVLYVGDDTNDEPAFEIGGNTVAVRIGKKRNSRASFYLRNQSEIDPLLGCLVALRKRWLAFHGQEQRLR